MVNPVWLICSPQSIGYIPINLKQLGRVTSYSSDSELGALQENKQHVWSYRTAKNGCCQQCKKAKEDTETKQPGGISPMICCLLGEEVGRMLLLKSNAAWLLLDPSTPWEEAESSTDFARQC